MEARSAFATLSILAPAIRYAAAMPFALAIQHVRAIAKVEGPIGIRVEASSGSIISEIPDKKWKNSLIRKMTDLSPLQEL